MRAFNHLARKPYKQPHKAGQQVGLREGGTPLELVPYLLVSGSTKVPSSSLELASESASLEHPSTAHAPAAGGALWDYSREISSPDGARRTDGEAGDLGSIPKEGRVRGVCVEWTVVHQLMQKLSFRRQRFISLPIEETSQEVMNAPRNVQCIRTAVVSLVFLAV